MLTDVAGLKNRKQHLTGVIIRHRILAVSAMSGAVPVNAAAARAGPTAVAPNGVPDNLRKQ
jgi:hypothetical protein